MIAIQGATGRTRAAPSTTLNRASALSRSPAAAVARTSTAALFLSESAVSKHVNAIFAKLGLDQEARVRRRVAAALAFLGGADPTPGRA
jgi:hypothetical protein